jgi:hypothetical protein
MSRTYYVAFLLYTRVSWTFDDPFSIPILADICPGFILVATC